MDLVLWNVSEMSKYIKANLFNVYFAQTDPSYMIWSFA